MYTTVKTLRTFITEAMSEKLPKYVHVSGDDMGSSVVLRPRIPRGATAAWAEDVTTPRVCFSTSLEGALKSVAQEYFNPEESSYYVYGTDVIPDMFVPHSGEFKWGYGLDDPRPVFDGTEEEWAKEVEGYVHDADVTGEVWSLGPIKVKLFKFVDRKDVA